MQNQHIDVLPQTAQKGQLAGRKIQHGKQRDLFRQLG